MRLVVGLITVLAFSACGTSEQPTAPVASVEVPPDWRSLRSEDVIRVIGASTYAFDAVVEGDARTNLDLAVSDARADGWVLDNRSESAVGGRQARLRRADDALLGISVDQVGDALHLSIILAPPEEPVEAPAP